YAPRGCRIRPRCRGCPRTWPKGADAVSGMLLTNIGELTTNVAVDGDRLGTIRDAAVLVEDGLVTWVGAADDAPTCDTVVDAGGRAVIPGFVDSHTHIVFGGDRAGEFAARMAGQSYSA